MSNEENENTRVCVGSEQGCFGSQNLGKLREYDPLYIVDLAESKSVWNDQKLSEFV